MAISFTPLKLAASDLFGIRLRGSFGRSDKKRLKDVAGRCLANGKIKLVLDLTELEAISGGGAKELAEFQRQLLERDGELVFVGATDTIRQFLFRSFQSLPLHVYPAVDAAVDDIHQRSAATSPQPDIPPPSSPLPSTQHPGRSTARNGGESTGEADGDAQTEAKAGGSAVIGGGIPDSSLDLMLEAYPADLQPGSATADTEGNTVAELEPRVAVPRPSRAGRDATHLDDGRRAVSPPPGTLDQSARGTARCHYLSPKEAVVSLQRHTGDADWGDQLSILLHCHDLAETVTICSRQEEWFVDEEGHRTFAAKGNLALALLAAQRPLYLLDLPADELDQAEAKFLTTVSPDLILPVVWNGELRAVAFLQHGKQDYEYSVSEYFALELLMRLLADASDSRAPSEVEAAAEATEENETSLVEDPVLFADGDSANSAFQWIRSQLRLAESLVAVVDERQFWERVHQRLVADHGVKELVVLVPAGDRVVPAVSFGVPENKVTKLEVTGGVGCKYLQRLARPVTANNLPASFKNYQAALGKADLVWLAPLQSDLDWLGVVILGEVSVPDKPSLDADRVAELFTRVASYLRRLQDRRLRDVRNLELIRCLMSLMEERHFGPGGMTGELICLVQLVAHEMGFTPEQEQDLVYGTILRDIGMFPTGDLIIDSFSNVSEEQWQEYKSHPKVGVQHLEGLPISSIVRDVVLYHHERFNGEGYPQGCAGHDIPLAARILAVVENYVAMVTTMPNRPALSRTQALEIIRENFGNRYDPEVVEVFVRILENVKSSSQDSTILVYA